MTTLLFFCKGCGCDVCSLINGANPKTQMCGKCERGENRTDGYLDGYTEAERNNRKAAARACNQRGAKQAHKPSRGRGVRALTRKGLGY